MHLNSLRKLWFLAGCLLVTTVTPLLSQSDHGVLDRYLTQYVSETDLLPADLSDFVVSDQYETKHNGVTHVHIKQRHAGIEVYNGTGNLTFQNGELVHVADRFERDLATRANTTQPAIMQAQAILAATQALEIISGSTPQLVEAKGNNQYLFSTSGVSQEPIPVQLVYLPGPEGELFLAWDLSIYTLDSEHWWSVRIDALTGKLLDKTDWVQHCEFPDAKDHSSHRHASMPAPMDILSIEATIASYRVIPYYFESPNHGPDSLLIDPANQMASPYGWHDINGVEGPEFTITRGNNVYASEDRDNDNVPGYSPDGDTSLTFDFPFNLNQAATAYEDAAITNLFYMNNIMHDIWYSYGFDEASGNFQENNYGRGGGDGDYVNADAQDGGGTNNANFATPPDGNNPRMQMYLWTSGGGAANLLTVNSPSVITGAYSASEATFGPGVPATPLTADVVLVDDGTNPDPEDACDPIVNAAALVGKIALIDRGNCSFVLKVEAAQTAGAVGVIVINNVAGGTFGMGGASNTITIPSIMISQADGNLIKARIAAGDTVNATLQNSTGNFDKDGDFDNGIIAHEYGHGISIRLTGGASNSGCLNNAEQMGEGWSDYFGMMVSLDTAIVNRGIGTFASGQPTTGQGIRNAPYSPDFAVNNFTYAATNNPGQISQPHGIGFVWCTMLWDMSLALVDQYGFDPDLYNGTGGNNLAMQLVIDGIKLQPCNPGFVDGRDAILLADQLNNGGANQCLIWEIFANRGLGFSADQGSSNSRTDQLEGFDVPPICQTPTGPPVSSFSFSSSQSCDDRITFTDQSTSTPQSWFWNFGDGNSDTIQNPIHTYNTSGTYQVYLVVTNTLGTDTLFQTAVVALPGGPVVADQEGCVGEQLDITITGTNIYTWFDNSGNVLQTGNVFSFTALTGDTSIMVDQIVVAPLQKIGPVDGSFSTGGYHNTGFTGTLNFTAEDELTILSAWLDAGSVGNRDIFLWSGIDGGGTVVDQVTVNITATGPQRVTLNLKVPAAGTYSLGGTSVDLFRNSTGANYPYVLPGLLSIFSSSANTGPQDFYYYLYDWEVQGRGCQGERVPVMVKAIDADFSYTKPVGGSLVTFTDESLAATTWAWDFGDGNTSTMQNPAHGYISQGTYAVSLTINGTCVKTDSVTVAYNTDLQSLAPGLELNMLPNPANDLVQIKINQPLAEDLSLALYSPEGKLVASRKITSGETSLSWSLDGLASGMYLVRVQHSQGVHTMKLVVRN